MQASREPVHGPGGKPCLGERGGTLGIRGTGGELPRPCERRRLATIGEWRKVLILEAKSVYRRPRRGLLVPSGTLLLAVLIATSLAAAEPPPLRVGTSGDYAPFSSELADGRLAGLSLDVARAYARDRGRRLELVRFRWPELSERFRSGDFDVVLSGVTVRPERSVLGRFTRPVLRSGAVVLVGESSALRTEALDAPDVRIGVNAGGHLERVTRARFPKARIHAVPANREVPGLLVRGEVDAVVSDTLESPHWRDAHPGLRALAPFTNDRKAAWVAPDEPELARDLDAWLGASERTGVLEELRVRHLATRGSSPVALALPALLAAIDERLDLMPFVAEAKRAGNLAVEDPEREALVLDAAARSVAAAARRRARPAPADDAVRALYRAQIDAAKAVQHAVLQAEPVAGPSYDLGEELRPALLRLGDQIAGLVVELGPVSLSEAHVASRGWLDTRGLGDEERRAIAAAIAGLQPE